MCMRAEEEKCALAKSVAALDERVDKIDTRLTAVETRQNEQTQMLREGFADVKAQLHDAYAEKVAWGDWARHALTDCGKWLGKWGAIILATAIGVGNLDKITALFH